MSAGWGDEDLARRAADLAGKLPEALAPLARIAYNYRWAWYPRGKEVFRDIDPGRWQLSGENPVRLLQEASSEALARAAGDAGLLARAAALEDAFAEGTERTVHADGHRAPTSRSDAIARLANSSSRYGLFGARPCSSMGCRSACSFLDGLADAS